MHEGRLLAHTRSLDSLGMTGLFRLTMLAVALIANLSCASKPDPNTLVMIIESSPTNLDDRVAETVFRSETGVR